MITYCIIALSIAAINGCQVPCRDTDTECYVDATCGCIKYIGEDFQTFLAENNEEECTADPCETVLCNDGETCYATSLGAKCIPPGGVGPACGAIGDPECKKGYECVSGTCVNPTYEDPTTAEPCILPLCQDPCPTGRCGLDQRCISQPTTQVDRPECPGCNEFVRCEPTNNGKPCGKNQCADNEFCCNESCGECAPIGGVCTARFCTTEEPSTTQGPVQCGSSTCKAGDVCCNESCGICTKPGDVCTQQVCGPTVTCANTLCETGQCFDTSLGPKCIGDGGIGPKCGNSGDPECKDGYECISGLCVDPLYQEPNLCPDNCSGYFDGCNACGCNADGTVGFCTQRYCFPSEYEEAKCTACVEGYVLDANDNCVEAPCGAFENCANYNDGCNDCECSADGTERCTERLCVTQGTPQCNQCEDGYELDTDETCVALPCDGLENCASYFDGCNQCQCNADGTPGYCTRIYCPDEEIKDSKCLACVAGYEFDANGKCVPAPCFGYQNCANYYDGCNNCICMKDGDACTKIECSTKGPTRCTQCDEGFRLDNDEIECIPECVPLGATFVGDNAFCETARFSCDLGFEYYNEPNCGCGCKPIVGSCISTTCLEGTECFDTSLGPKCIPPGGVGEDCGGNFGDVCKEGYECILDGNEAGASGVCVNPTYQEPDSCPTLSELGCLDPCIDYTDIENPFDKCLKNEKCKTKRKPLKGRPECLDCPKFKKCKPRRVKCGSKRCPQGQVCCNSSCGICTPPGGFCTQVACFPDFEFSDLP